MRQGSPVFSLRNQIQQSNPGVLRDKSSNNIEEILTALTRSPSHVRRAVASSTASHCRCEDQHLGHRNLLPMVRPVAQPRMAASDLAAPCLASDPCLIHQVGASVTWPQRQKYARLASTTHVRGAPRGGKETLKGMDTTRSRSLGMIVSPDSGTREGRAHDLVVPAAWVRVRLAWQVPRPIDDTRGPIPGLIVACYARVRFDDLYLCFSFLVKT